MPGGPKSLICISLMIQVGLMEIAIRGRGLKSIMVIYASFDLGNVILDNIVMLICYFSSEK